MEMVADCTYPYAQTLSMSLLDISHAVQSVLMMNLEVKLKKPLTDEEMEIQTCSSKGGAAHEVASDYTPYMIFLLCYTGLACLLCTFFFKPPMTRWKADRNTARLPGDISSSGV